MTIKAFRDWKFEDVERTFGLRRLYEHPLLTQWQAHEEPIDEETGRYLERLRQELIRTVDMFNEAELKVYFIGPLLTLVPFRTEQRRPFLDRPMSFLYGEGQQAAGRVDWMLAEGRQEPRQPFFFLHEYKKEPEAQGDPLGQLLIAMVGAQQQNERAFPVLGSYVVRRSWFFVLLDRSEYAVSLGLDATRPDLKGIYHMLHFARRHVASTVARYAPST